MPVDVDNWQCGPNVTGDSEEDTVLLRGMYTQCVEYIQSFQWAPPIKSVCLAYGAGGVLAVFLVTFLRPIGDEDSQLWVVVGDLPAAYMVVDEAKTVDEALLIYCEMMSCWAEAVLGNRPLDNVFPVAAAPTKLNAELLISRITFIRRQIVPTGLQKSRGNPRAQI